MILLLDYDGTYTADPDFWLEFIIHSKAKGHLVYCVTMRYEKEGKPLEDSIGRICEIVYTNRMAKKSFMIDWLEKMNIRPQALIWIDDQPEFLFTDG